MHITKDGSQNRETPNQTVFWSYFLAIVSVFAVVDVLTGGQIRESLEAHKIEYAVAAFTMIVSLGDLIKDGPPGLKFSLACSRHKL